jgi:hypothetical protein
MIVGGFGGQSPFGSGSQHPLFFRIEISQFSIRFSLLKDNTSLKYVIKGSSLKYDLLSVDPFYKLQDFIGKMEIHEKLQISQYGVIYEQLPFGKKKLVLCCQPKKTINGA